MKRHINFYLPVLCMLLGLISWGCDKVEEDVVPNSFQEFKLFPDDIYLFSGSTIRLDNLINDSIKSNVSVTYTQPLHGELVPGHSGPGKMGYRPNAGFTGVDSLTYEVCNTSACKTEKIKLIVEPPINPSSCSPWWPVDTLVVAKNTPKQLRVLQNHTICESYVEIEMKKPVKGTSSSMQYDGSYKNVIYTYYPPKDFVGEDTFEYNIYYYKDTPPGSSYWSTGVVTVIVK